MRTSFNFFWMPGRPTMKARWSWLMLLRSFEFMYSTTVRSTPGYSKRTLLDIYICTGATGCADGPDADRGAVIPWATVTSLEGQ